jgi:hypothetical protein
MICLAPYCSRQSHLEGIVRRIDLTPIHLAVTHEFIGVNIEEVF